jgi:hypothetical protein
MSNQTERRDFLKTVGVASIIGGLGETARSQEKEQSIKGSAGKETLPEHPFEMMICDYVRFKLSKVGKHGEIIWEHSPPAVKCGRSSNKRFAGIGADSRPLFNMSVQIRVTSQ